MIKEITINNLVSLENHYCEGFFGGYKNNQHILGLNYSLAKMKQAHSHDGSALIDEICVFDKAEVTSANLGQINLIQVSSFSGPNCAIWGYDICKAPLQKSSWNYCAKECGLENTQIYDIDMLVDSFTRLTGTVQNPRFPFLPGSHVPCAMKMFKQTGECEIYVASGLGIPKNRGLHASLLMEDCGMLTRNNRDQDIKKIIKNLIHSYKEIGKNHNTVYEKIFIGFKSLKVAKNEIGCALASSPYFYIAKKAIPQSESLSNLTIDQWEKQVSPNFLYNKI